MITFTEPLAAMIKVSAVIITLNEEKNLERCLLSLAGIVDEIVVVDSFSTDNTVAIAQQYNARVVQQLFLGYGAQKNFASGLAANDWVLSLDADEVLSNELRQSILHVKDNPSCSGYFVNRLTKYCGKWIRHCGWYPDKQLRLFNSKKASWQSEQVHEYIAFTGKNEQVGKLHGDLLHYSFYSISDHIKKIEKYSELSARAAVAKGKRTTLLKVWVSPKWHFFNDYFIKAGFLDGFYGYTICKLSAYAAFIKYTKIYLYSKEQKK